MGVTVKGWWIRLLPEIFLFREDSMKLRVESQGGCCTDIFSLESQSPFSYTIVIQVYNPIPPRRLKMAKPMTKAQIVSHFAEKFELSKKTSGMIMEEMAALAVSETRKTGSFTVPGIGKLVLAKRKARMGRNPATGKAIKIPAKTVVKMRVGKAAKEAIVPKKK
jgi:DNA-binding protein HU-beta